MSNLYVISIALTIGANVSYHLFQKSISVNAHPMISLAVTYVVALVATCVVLPFLNLRGGLVGQLMALNWATFALGVSLLALELGFLLAYRAGWQISIAAVFSNVAVTVLLIPIGIIFFKERLNLYNVIGILLAVASLWLMSKRS
ncbi:MAG TPA: hypothetical protein VNM90_12810 [Haliangium sp.]|nr:hypothetical protein [Haliangium sp.]